MTQPYADARVEVSLDWGDLDTELRTRIERATQLAARVAQKHLDKIAAHARKVADDVAKHFDDAGRSIATSMATAAQLAGKAADGMKRSFQSATRDMVLRAKGAVASIRRELDRIGDVTIGIDVDSAGASAALDTFASHLAALTDKTLTVDVDTAAAITSLATLSTTLDGLSDRAVSVSVNLAGATVAQLRAVARELDKIATAGNPTVTATVNLAGSSVADLRSASRSVKGLAEEMARLQTIGGVTARIDIGGDADQLRAAARIKGLAKELRDLQTIGHVRVQVDFDVRGGVELQALLLQLQRNRRVQLDVQGDSVGRTSGAMSGLLGSLGRVGSVAASAGKLIGVAGTAVVGLAGAAPAVAALASALAAVGAAAGAAGIALASAGAMGVGTLKVGLSGVSDAFKAMGQSASGSGASAASQLKAVESAQYNLTKAVRDERDAQKGVGDARKDALRNLQDLNDELGESALSEKDAALSLREAQRDLAKGGFEDPLDRERAQLRVAQAEQRLGKVRKDGARLQEDVTEANRKGVDGSDEVVAANQRLQDSTRAVKEARDALNDAMNPSSSGKDPMAEALAKLSPNARAFVLAVQGLKPAWDAVKNAVQDTLFDGMAARVSSLGATYLPILRGAMQRTAAAFHEGAVGVADFLQSGTGINVVSTWLNSSATLAGNLGKSLAGLAPGFAAIGASATSVFARMSSSLGGVTQQWSQQMVAMQQDGRMDQVIQTAVDVAKQLGAVLADVGGILKGVFTAASAAGGGFLGTLGQSLDALNQWVNSFQGQTALTGFFQAMSTALAAVLPLLTQALGIIGGTVAPAIAELITTMAPAIQGLIGGLGQGLAALAPAMAPLGQAIGSIATALAPVLPVLGQLITTIIEIAGPIIGSLAQALGPVLTAVGQALIPVFDALRPALAPLGQAFQAIGGALVKLAPVLGGVARIVATVLAQAITAVSPIISILADVLGKVFEALTPLIEPILQLVMTAMQPLIKVVQLLAPILTKIGGIFAQVVTILVSQGLVPLIQQMAKYWGELFAALMPLLPPLMELVGALLPLGLQLFQAFLPIILKLVTWLTELATKAITGLVVPALNLLVPIITKVVGFVTDLVTWVSNAIAKFAEWSANIGEHITAVKNGVVNGLTTMINWLQDLPGKVGAAVSGMWDGLKNGFKGVLNWIIDAWNNFSIKITLPSMLGGKTLSIDTPNLPRLASGGGIGQTARRGRDGKISGPGGPLDDLIVGFVKGMPKIRVSNDEMVMSGLATRRNYPLLAAMNRGWDWRKMLPGLASGGTTSGREPYGLPAGTNTGGYGSSGSMFPQWVHDIEQRFGVKASTYAGHQEDSGKNKGIDWVGSVPAMQKFAEYLLGIKGELEQVIWMNPDTGQQIGVADGQQVGPGTSQPGYYRDDWDDHTNHVHTRQSYSFGGSATTAPGIDTPGTTAGTTSSGTPIGSGIGSSSSSGTSGTSGSSSWGNSGGGSQFNSAADAKRGGVTPVWVENWPASIGGSTSIAPTTTAPGGGDPTSIAPGNTGGGDTTVPTLSATSSKDEVAKAIIAQGRKRGYSDEQIQAVLATAVQESNLDPRADGGDQGIGGALGIFQQGNSYGAREDRFDPNKAIDAFYSRLDKADGKTGDIWEKVVGVQQHGGAFAGTSGDHKYMGEIKSQQDAARKLFDANKGSAADTNIAPKTPTSPTIDPNKTTTPTTPTTPVTPTTVKSESMPYGKARADQWWLENRQTLAENLRDQVGEAALKSFGDEFADMFGLKGLFDKVWDTTKSGISKDGFLIDAKTTPEQKIVQFANTVIFNGTTPAETKKQTTAGMTAITETNRSG